MTEKHQHDWNDAVVFDGPGMEHAQAICDVCGRVAFERGHTPKKAVYIKSHVEARE